MIVEKNNFINNEFCNYFIKYHKDNFERNYNNKDKWTLKHEGTHIMNCEAEALKGDAIFKILLAELNFLVRTYFKDTVINFSQIVKWPTKEKQEEHLDFDHHTHTSILYLNDDYKGGETVVGNKVIKPEKGKIILFEGCKLKHQVLEIKSGVRYTNPTWYMTQNKKENKENARST
jgi:hypothetical protein